MTPDPLPSLRERKKAATRERLYFEALDLFRRKGFAETTIDEIAEAAEVSRGTFFNYFATKEAVLHYLGERLVLACAPHVQAALLDPALDARQKLLRILGALVDSIAADRELTRVAIFEFMKVPAAIVADPYRALLRQTVSALLIEGQGRGEVAPGLDPDLLASAITGIYFQQIFEWCAAENPFPLAGRLDRIITALWAGLGAPPATHD
jgi:AcrR family transcriptional regulator